MTDKKRPSVRSAKPADFIEFYGRTLPWTARAWVAETEGRVIGIAGWYRQRDGISVVFSDMKEEMRQWPGLIMRETYRLMSRLPSPAICVANEDEDNAPRFLKHFGWKEVGETKVGKVFRWDQQSFQ